MVKTPEKTKASKNWKEDPPSEEEIKLQKRAMALYLIETDQVAKFPKVAIATFRLVLPHLGKLVPKWDKVKPTHFKQAKYVAYKRLYDTWRHQLESAIDLKSLIGEITAEADDVEDGSSSSDLSDQEDAEDDDEKSE